jgi:mono/diheme cytochrome c family protein
MKSRNRVPWITETIPGSWLFFRHGFETSKLTWRHFMLQSGKAALTALALVFVFGLLSLAHAGPKGSETKGRHFFRETCKECHIKGAPGGEVTPLNKTMAQWREYFAKGTHNHGKEPLTKYLPADQLLDASTFLIQHAADSPQPETCGK